MNYLEKAEKIKDEVIEWRRHIHSNPESGENQPHTVAYVMSKLKSFGLEPEALSGGVVALIKGGKPGKTIMLRADMDALNMKEESGLPFKSKNEGIAHCCGHDLHTSMLLGAAKLLSENRENIKGNVKLLFQPSEETGTGAARMIKAGVLENPHVDAVYGQHMYIATEDRCGTLSISSAVTLASNSMFEIRVHGKGSHGARPQTAVDPLNILCHIYISLQAINARLIDPKETIVLTIGEIKGGSMPNSIPDSASMRGTIRALNNATHQEIKKKMVQIVENTARAFSGEAEVIFDMEMPATVNNTEMVNEIKGYLSEILDDDMIKEMPVRMGSEDFSRYGEKVPSVFGFLSGGSIDEGYIVGSHNPKVVYSEDSIPNGVASYAQVATRWLEEHS